MKSPCKIVEIENGWPDFMLCDNNNVYADGCPVSPVYSNILRTIYSLLKST